MSCGWASDPGRIDEGDAGGLRLEHDPRAVAKRGNEPRGAGELAGGVRRLARSRT